MTDARRVALVVLASLAAVWLPRWGVRSTTPYNWDAASFTLAVDDIDLAQHRPHPPAALGFVLTARALRPMAGSAHAALVLENMLLAVLSCVLIFMLARGDPASPDDRRAWIAWFVLVTSVQHAFNSVVAEVYMSELATTLLVAVLAVRAWGGSARALTGMMVALALAGAFRLTGMVFMAPLALWVLLRAPVDAGARRTALAAGGVVLAGWLGAGILAFGLDELLGRTWTQFTTVSADTSLVATGALRQLNRNLRDVAASLLTGVGLWHAMVVPLILARRRPPEAFPVPLVPALLWFVPACAFFVFVHMGKPGYTLMLLPILALVVAQAYSAVAPSTRRALAVIQVAAFALHFFWGAAPSGAAIGEGLAYRDKTMPQQILTEARAVLATGAPALREAERDLHAVSAAVPRDCSARVPVFVAGDGEGFNWRRAMQAFPGAIAVRLPAPSTGGVFVGHEGRFTQLVNQDVVVEDGCAVIWLADRLPPAISEAPGAEEWPLVVPAPVILDLTPDVQLVVRR